MSKTVLNLLMTFDGFVAGPHDEIDWIEKNYGSAADTDKSDKPASWDMGAFTSKVGAIIVGYRSYELGVQKGWFKDQMYGPSPIFVLCKEAPNDVSKDADFRFVTEGIETIHKKASEAAGQKWIYLFGGPGVVQQFLEKKLVDELRITIAPVLIGTGIRLFDNLSEQRTGLERLKVAGYPNGMIEVHYRIMK